MNLNRKIFLIITIFFLVIVIGNSGCGPIKEYPTTPSQPSIGTGTKFRFINCSVGSTPVDLYVNNQKVFSYVTFKLSTALIDIGPGLKEFKVRENGKSVDLFKDSIYLDLNKSYSLHLINQFPNVSLKLTERPSQSPSSGKALVRLAHIDNSLPELDFAISSLTENFLIAKVPYNSITNLLEIKIGKNTFDVRNSLNQQSYFTTDAWLQANKIYTIYIFGFQGARDSTMLTANFLDETNINPQNLFSFELGTSKIRFINGYIDSTPMEFLVDSARVYTSLAYNQSTAMLSVNSGGRNVRVNMGSSRGIVDTFVALEKDKKYSLTVQKTPGATKAIFFEIPPKTIVGSRSYLRFVNSSTNLNPVHFKVTNVNGTTNIYDIKNGDLSDYVEVLTGQNSIVVYDFNHSNLLSSSAYFEGGKVYTAFLFGSYSDSAKNTLTLNFIKDNDSSGQSLFTFSPVQTNIRVINGSYDSPALDLLVDEAKVVGGLNYRNSSSLTKVNTGRRNISIKAFGIITPVIETNFTFEADKNYLLFLGNKFSNLEAMLNENPTRQPTLGKSTIRFFNGVFDLSSIDIKITNSLGTTLISSINFKTMTNYLELTPGTNEILVNVAGTQTTVLTSEANLESGTVYTAYFLGAQGQSGGKEYTLGFMKENNTNSQTLSTFPALKSNLRFINGSTDNPLLDLTVDDNIVANSVSYKLATSILKVNSGNNRSFKLKLFGSTSPIFSKEYSLTYNKNYTFLVTNKTTSLEGILFENPTKVAPIGKTSLRLIHGAYDVGNVDLTINTNGVKTKITNLPYKSVSNYFDISAGYSELILTNSATGSIIYSAADATLEANKVYSIYFLGDNSGKGGTEYSMNFLNENDSNGQYLFTYSSINFAKLRFINASPNSGGIDLYVDDNKVASNQNFTQSAGYQFIRSGERNIKLYPAGKTNPTLLNFNYQFELNKNYSLIVMDSLVKLTPVLLEDANYTSVTGKAFVRFINASADAPPFDIKIGSSTGVIKHSYFSYQQVTEYEQYDPAVLSFIFTQANTNIELLSLRGFSMVANRAYTIIIMGFANGTIGQTLTVRWFLDN